MVLSLEMDGGDSQRIEHDNHWSGKYVGQRCARPWKIFNAEDALYSAMHQQHVLQAMVIALCRLWLRSRHCRGAVSAKQSIAAGLR